MSLLQSFIAHFYYMYSIWSSLIHLLLFNPIFGMVSGSIWVYFRLFELSLFWNPLILMNIMFEVTHIYRVYNWTARPTRRRPSRRVDGPPGVLYYRKTPWRPARRLDGGVHRLDDTPVVWTAPLHWTEMTIGCTGQSSNWTARPTTPRSRPWAGRPVRRLDGHVHRRDGPPVGWTETFIGVDGPPVDHIGGMIHAPWLLLLHSGKAEQQDVQAFLPSFGESHYCTAHFCVVCVRGGLLFMVVRCTN